MGVTDEVKQKTDIVEVISQYVSLTKSGRTFKALCPFHSEKNPSFFVYPERQSWHCFGACNTGGDVFSFVMKKQGIGFGEVLRLLAERAGISVSSRFEPEAAAKEKERLYEINQTTTQYFHNLLLNSAAAEKARHYLSGRGLLPKSISDFQLGFSLNSWEALKQYMLERGYTEKELLTAGLLIESEGGGTHDRFRNKVMFPICDSRGRVTGFGARVLDDSLPKYINSPQTPVFDKSGNLYGINLAATAIRQQDLAVIVEGYMDVITAHQNGFSNVVASMGTSVTEKQVNILKRLTRNLLLALDADAAGEEAMLRGVGYENILDAEVRVVVLPEGKDPDDIIKEDSQIWQGVLKEALPVIDYTFNMVASGLNLTTARDKSAVTEKLLPIIAEIKNDIRRDHYLQKLAGLIGVGYTSVEAALKGYMVRQKTGKPIQARAARPSPSLVSSPVEEYCLALLLQHPELKNVDKGLFPEYFENSENREILIAWQKSSDLPSLKAELDPAIHGYLDLLLTKSLPGTQIEERYADCVRRLRIKYLRSLEAKIGEVLASEARAGGTAAELAKLREQGTEISVQLRELFYAKERRGK